MDFLEFLSNSGVFRCLHPFRVRRRCWLPRGGAGRVSSNSGEFLDFLDFLLISVRFRPARVSRGSQIPVHLARFLWGFVLAGLAAPDPVDFHGFS